MVWLHKLVAIIVLSVHPQALDCHQKSTTRVIHHDKINLIDPNSKLLRRREELSPGRYVKRKSEFQDNEKSIENVPHENIFFEPKKVIRNGTKRKPSLVTYQNVEKQLPITQNSQSKETGHRKKTLEVYGFEVVSKTSGQNSFILKDKAPNKDGVGRNKGSKSPKITAGYLIVPIGRPINRLKRDAMGTTTTTWTVRGSTPSFLPSLLPASTEMTSVQSDTKIGMAPVASGTTGQPDKPERNYESTVIKTPMNTNFRMEFDVPDFKTDRDDLHSSNVNPDTEPEPWPEPGPDWSSAYMYLGAAWFIHIYGIATIMFFVALVSAVTLIDMAANEILTSRGLSTSLNCLLLLFGSSRGISLVLNPYGSLEHISLLASRLLWSVGFPCLTSMLTTLLLVLVDTTKISLGPPKFQQFHVVMLLSIGHFIFVLGTDIILSFYLGLKALLLVCQLIYITWSILLTVGYYRVGYLISRNFSASRDARGTNDDGSKRLERLIFACGTVALFNCITNLYGAVGVFGVYSDLTYVRAWPWWVFQTLMRVEEICMCLIVLTLAGKSRRECNITSEDKKGFICACWLKLKSLLGSKRERGASQIEPQDAERGQREVVALGPWNTYGTNSPNNSSSGSFGLHVRKQTSDTTSEETGDIE